MTLESQVEKELLRKCRGGAPRFYEPVVRAYEAPALRAATAILGDGESARDAVQDAFVRAYRSLDEFDLTRPFAPWFFGILRNRCRDLARSRTARERRRRRMSEEGVASAETGGDAREDVERRELRRTVRRALEQVSREEREVLVFRDVEGFTYREISEILEIPEGTVASRLYAARRALRAVLEEMGVETP